MKEKLELLLVDDDERMRLVLEKAFMKNHQLQIVGSVESGEKAIEFAANRHIDVACLDVDMPGINGVEAAKQILDINPKCAIVFITAHDDYMSDAFELYAFDYIVKPFRLERLNRTITKLIDEKIDFRNNALIEDESVVKAEIGEADSKLNHIAVKVKDGMEIISVDDILLVERVQRQTVIVTKENKYIVNKTMQEMEAVLGDVDFIRSHKSYIIRIDAIISLKIYGRWTYVVKLKGIKDDALLTKEKSKQIVERFEVLD